jgi:hypothetical protein
MSEQLKLIDKALSTKDPKDTVLAFLEIPRKNL